MNDNLSRRAAITAVFLLSVTGLASCKRPPTPTPIPSPVTPAKQQLSASEAARLQRLAQVGAGHLENLQLGEAAPIFKEIVEKLPDEILGVRNLAICQYLLYEQSKGSHAAVEAAADRLQEVQPDSPVSFWLLGKAAQKAYPTNLAAAVDQLSMAAERAADDARFKYALHEVAKIAAEQDGSKPASDALRAAYDLAPDNIFILNEWMLAQAEAQDPDVGKTIAHARQTLAPLREAIQNQHRSDVGAFLDGAESALASGDWPKVVRNVRFCRNVTISNDFAQSDKRWLSPHALEYMVHDFSDSFREQYPQPQADHALIEVAFKPLPAEQQPAIEGELRDAILVDFNLDRRVDLAVLTANTLQIHARDSDKGDWAVVASVDLSVEPRGVLAADLDWDRDHKVEDACFDADVDFVVYGAGGLVVVRNVKDEDSGERRLEAVLDEQLSETLTDITTGCLVDFDHDCNLDVVVATKHGIVPILAPGNWTSPNRELQFEDVARFSSLALPEEAQITSLVPVDWDRDVDIDIVAVSAGKAVGYLENLRHGDFRWREFGEGFESLLPANSLAVIESDANVSWDIVGGGPSGVSLVQTRTIIPGSVQPKASVVLSTESQSDLIACDFDNNAAQDVIGWTDDSVTAWRGNGEGGFSQMADLIGDVPHPVKQCRTADIDSDGDLDLCLIGAQQISLYLNEGGNKNNWLTLRALGQADNKGAANHHGLGSLIEVKAGSMYQAQVVSQPVTHFGLGAEERASIVRLLWTNGVPQDVIEPESNQAICEVMTLKGSCPYIYTWTGDRYEFFTDCLWAAPIGLQLAEDVVAPTRSWEYLRIPGERLAQRDGKYWLQLTEELWEAGYFDYARLIAVDHPADVEVFSNEKVGPPSISEFKLHTVRQRRYPIAARDQHGRDVLATLRQRDDNYLQAFDKILAPGRAEEHYLELELGDLDSPRQVTLFMTGWIYPTDTSMNVALSRQTPQGGPRPPAVLVPDGEGQWREVQAYMGFPGGKTKTIAVDLSSAFLTKDYRVRIATSAQIYWDEVFFTVDEESAEVRLSNLVLNSADLHYRGFSRPLPSRPRAPDRYDYQDRFESPKWAPMKGSFTRYGDVGELLAEADDRMAILGSGDELTVSFIAPVNDPPAGWVRDFVLHNVGYDKDADLNTIYGQTVEPLPYQAMPAYPYPPDASFPDTAAHIDYLRNDQTRSLDATKFWRRIKEYEPPAK